MTVQEKIDRPQTGDAKGVVQLIAAAGNANFADKIAAALLRAGYRLDPGDFDTNRVDAVIVLWTGVALDKPELVAVARAAWKAGRLAPVSIGRIEPPFGARDAAPMDLAGWRGDDEDPRWRFVLSDLESIRIRQRVSGETDAGDLAAPVLLAADEPLRIHHPARRLWRDHIRPSAAPFAAGMAVMSIAGLAAFFLGARNDRTTAPALRAEIEQTGAPRRLRDGASLQAAGGADSTAQPVQLAAQTSAIETDMAADDDLDEPRFDANLAFVRPAEDIAVDEPAEAEDLLQAPADTDAEAPSAALETQPEEIAAIHAPRLKADALAPSLSAPDEPPAASDPPTEEVAAADLNQQALSALSTAASAPAPAPTNYLGDYFSDCAACPDMAALDGGAFTMGAAPGEAGRDPAESPQRRVNIGYRFAIATRETTFDQWTACVADGGCQSYAPADAGWGRGARPVINVSYEDASAYARWLSAKTGKYYRLPSEAEWEYAARAGTATPFALGRSLSSDRANINGSSPYNAPAGLFRAQTVAVTAFQPNVYGLFDMHGNVWEWTSDCWSASHNGGPATGAARIDGDCSRRVIKGGAWNSPASDARSAHRQSAGQMAQTSDIGFRVVRVLD